MTNVLARDLRFVQITDVRYSKTDNSEVLSKVIKDVNKQKDVDFVVFTGDSLNKPSQENLEDFVKQVKKLKKPVYILIGDRDVNKHKDLSKKQFMAYLKKKLPNYKEEDINYTFERGGVVFIVADGAKDVIPSTIGYYKSDVTEWVDTSLNLYPKKNVIILQHFPIIPPENKENYITFKGDKYVEMLQKHDNVKAVVAGHFGVNKEETVNGIVHISTAPAPYYRIIDITNCTSKNPEIWAQIKEVQF
jgi:3',5'-cyclic AMP phosphodiesterase CpdA